MAKGQPNSNEGVFYTLRKAGNQDTPTYELTKWSEYRDAPLDIYAQWIVQRSDNTFSVHSCNCPSRSNPCKHAPISIALLETNLPLQEVYHDGAKVNLAKDL